MPESFSLGRRVAAALLVAAGLGGTTGCEFITALDRSTIPGEGGAPGAGGAGGAGGEGGSVGPGGGEGGSGGAPIPCSTPADCPGADDECQTRTCEGGTCGVDHAPQNKPVASQTPSDCRRNVCDGQGNVISVDDDTDVLVDGDPCSADLCEGGAPSNPTAPLGTPCDTGGGHFCNESGSCVECLVGGDCSTGVCDQDSCVAPTCGDGVANGGETDVDCGGPDCVRCPDLQQCVAHTDCLSGICQAGLCAASTCSDFVQNGQETDVDCGGPACGPCATGEGCGEDADCLSGTCSGTVCLPGCTDGMKNGTETGIDCGGGVCPACQAGGLCVSSSDCLTGICANGVCSPPICGDGVVNNNEPCDDANQSNTDECLVGCVLPTCGDGYVRAGVEDCDDANQDNTDGCVAGCAMASCGDGYLWDGFEICDDGNNATGDGCSPTCTLENCGNGVIDALESCDDGDSIANDGCSANCEVEAPYTCNGAPSVCTSPAEINCNDGVDNDADGSADCVDTDCALGCNPVAFPCGPGETLLVYASTAVPMPIPDGVTTPTANSVIVGSSGTVLRVVPQVSITHTYTGDIDLFLQGPEGTNVELSTDNGSSGDNYTNTIFHGGCAVAITSGAAPYNGCYRPELPLTPLLGIQATGTWALRVADDFGTDTGTLTAWRLALCVPPTGCGDGSLDAGETCDDADLEPGDGCSGGCAIEPGFTCAGAPTVCTPICGDGLVVLGEACDDGDLDPGDGCDAACAVETGYACYGAPSDCVPLEVEPNGTFAEADARALDPAPTLITDTAVFAGAINPIADKDIFRIEVATDSVVRFETFDASGGDCPSSGFTTVLRLFDAAGTQLYTDSTSGIASCSLLTVNLAPGTYYVQVEESGNNALLGPYRLGVSFIPCTSLEVEPNENATQFTPLPVGSPICIQGTHPIPADLDFFQINVPVAGLSLHAETIEGSSVETCESNNIDSTLTLFSSTGVSPSLGTDDADGRGVCSKIDGTGNVPVDSWAHNLAAGVYYMQVATNGSTPDPQVFDYRLILELRAP